jgi:hypothetical protein
MLVVLLKGGLGNQLFQYSIGRALSLEYNIELKLDLSFLIDRTNLDITYRNFELSNFNINASIATKKELIKYKKYTFKSFFKFYSILNFTENNFTYKINYIEKKTHIYLDGFWQSEKYFKKYRNSLLNELVPIRKPNDLNKEYINLILNSNSISVHIRRGDYISNNNANTFHGLCSIDYYLNAISYIINHIKNPVFYFFSDDINWVKNNFDNSSFQKYFISHNFENTSFEDLRLMTYCKHNIIANSTFSWWGAWLNTNPNKIVIAPSKWFVDLTMISEDLIPESWIKI